MVVTFRGILVVLLALAVPAAGSAARVCAARCDQPAPEIVEAESGCCGKGGSEAPPPSDEKGQGSQQLPGSCAISLCRSALILIDEPLSASIDLPAMPSEPAPVTAQGRLEHERIFHPPRL